MPRKLRYRTASELDAAVDAYTRRCRENGEPFTSAGMALAIGFESRQSLYDYKGRPEFEASVSRARLMLEDYAERSTYSKDQYRGGMFSLKCNFGWKDDDAGATICAPTVIVNDLQGDDNE